MSRFAENTSVSSASSRAEIENTLTRYGATAFMYGTSSERAVIQFEMHDRRIRFEVPLPNQQSDEFLLTPSGRRARSPQDAIKAWEQACRQRWRALALVIKAKLEAVETGITEFEDEFLAHVVLPDGQSVGSWMRPQVAAAYKSKCMPSMLPEFKAMLEDRS